MYSPLMFGSAIVATSIAAALIALLILSGVTQRRRPRPALGELAAPLEQAVFLFDRDELVDATGAGHALLSAIPGQGSEWARLRGYLSQRLGGFESEMGALPRLGEVQMQDPRGELRLRAEWLGELSRLTVTDLTAEGQNVLVDALSQRAQEAELRELRETVASAPVLIWRSNATGAVVWANHAYLDCAAERLGLSVQTISTQLGLLERQLGQALFAPQGRSLILTEADVATILSALDAGLAAA